MSRIAPARVAAIDFEGRRYSPAYRDERDEEGQRTGFLAVDDIATGQRVATIKAYSLRFDPALEGDVQDVFFKRMELDVANRRLLIESERGVHVEVAIDGLAVTPIAMPTPPRRPGNIEQRQD